ncbi:ATP12-domain-containing protein [Dentipellis sp. KUC8613]|nr:ATP12-domain-containing protein [Dentipellis sp. KUC8613]
MQAARLARSLSPLVASTCRRRVWDSPMRFHLRRYATPQGAAPATATNRAEATLKRFWKTVDVEKRGDSLAVTLDKRPLKTPSGNQLLIPQEKKLVATLIATEWENQETLLKPHALPMTSLTARAIDNMRDEASRAEVRAALLKYLDTDTVCFYSDEPPPLVRLQQEHWDPLLDWVRKTFDVEIQTSESVIFFSQPEETKKKLDEVLSKFDPWQMAAMERATYTTKSFLIALALVHKHLTAEQAAAAAQVEVASQIERWGEVEDSHDVDYHDVRRHLGSSACLLANV